MKTVTMYEAEDGSQFRSAHECFAYEQKNSDVKAANDMLKGGSTLIEALAKLHETNPWWDIHLSEEDKRILMNTTKDTLFRIQHWQGCNKPAYKPCAINHAGYVLLCGEAGSWSGSFCEWVGAADLLCYARETEKYAQESEMYARKSKIEPLEKTSVIYKIGDKEYAVRPCTCENDYQDVLYGRKVRLHTISGDRDIREYKCSVCGRKP